MVIDWIKYINSLKIDLDNLEGWVRKHEERYGIELLYKERGKKAKIRLPIEDYEFSGAVRKGKFYFDNFRFRLEGTGAWRFWECFDELLELTEGRLRVLRIWDDGTIDTKEVDDGKISSRIVSEDEICKLIFGEVRDEQN